MEFNDERIEPIPLEESEIAEEPPPNSMIANPLYQSGNPCSLFSMYGTKPVNEAEPQFRNVAMASRDQRFHGEKTSPFCAGFCPSVCNLIPENQIPNATRTVSGKKNSSPFKPKRSTAKPASRGASAAPKNPPVMKIGVVIPAGSFSNA